jgi:CubicO group peptidase (beta-lactamase class C family)
MSTPEAPLERLLAERQADRLPSVAAAVGRKGEVLWSSAVGSADYADGRAATPDTQYRIGSITKTFTATAVMQLYAAGELDLDDRLEQHIEGIANGSPTIRRLLAHLSGLQREAGEMFVTGESPTEEQLVESMSGIEFVSRPGEQHHYSNLAFALLGQVVARKSGTPYMQYVDERIIRPLGLARCGAVVVDRRGPDPLGSVPRRGRRRGARREGDRRDVVPAGHVLPRRVGARLGARDHALQQ